MRTSRSHVTITCSRNYRNGNWINSSMNREQTEDLKAFEQRLTECVGYIRAKTSKWRVLLVMVVLWTAVSLWLWWRDDTDYDSYVDMMMAHKNLTASLLALFFFYLFGVFERNNGPHIITSRCRVVLQDYNMSCDEQGKLILKRPKPTHDPWRPG